MFKFVLFAFYTLIISHHICCFSVHSIAKLFAQPSVFDVPEFSPIHSPIFTLKKKTTQKHQHHNTQTPKRPPQLRFCVRTNNQQRYQKTKNTKFFTSHPSVFHKLKLFPYLILPESYKQKRHTTPEVLIFWTSRLTKSHGNDTKKHRITPKHSRNTKITLTSLYFTSKTLLFESFRLLSESFRLLSSLLGRNSTYFRPDWLFWAEFRNFFVQKDPLSKNRHRNEPRRP